MAVNFHRVQRTYSLLLNIMTFCCSSTCVVWRCRKYYCLEDMHLNCSFPHRHHEHPFYRPYESLSTFCWYKTQKWNYRNFLILSFFGRYLYRRRKTNTWLWTEQYFRGQEWADSHCWMCCFMVSLTDLLLLDTAYCSLLGFPLWGCPFIQSAHTLNALNVPHGMKWKEGRLMLKRCLRWILPMVVLVLIAMYFVLSPVVASHAAGPAITPSHITMPHGPDFDFFWRHW